MSRTEELEVLRNEVKVVTGKIIKLLGKRLELTRKIGKIKVSLGMPIIDPKVENELRKSVSSLCKKNGVNEIFGLLILNLLIKESIKEEKRETK
jgi:chorismate mutase